MKDEKFPVHVKELEFEEFEEFKMLLQCPSYNPDCTTLNQTVQANPDISGIGVGFVEPKSMELRSGMLIAIGSYVLRRKHRACHHLRNYRDGAGLVS